MRPSVFDVQTFGAPDIVSMFEGNYRTVQGGGRRVPIASDAYSIDVGGNYHIMLIDLLARCRSLVEFEVALMVVSKARYLPDNLGEDETVNAYRQIGEAVGLSQMAVEAIARRLVPWAL